jgi:hypothetical protein
MGLLAQAGESSVSFAINWSGFLFLEQKTPLMLWDNFVLRHDDQTSYFKAMPAAHSNQVPRESTAFEQLGAIQRMASWNVQTLLEDASKFMAQTSWAAIAQDGGASVVHGPVSLNVDRNRVPFPQNQNQKSPVSQTCQTADRV